MIGYLTTVTTIVTCLLLVLVIRFANKLTKQIENTSIQANVRKEKKINLLVTSAHISVMLGFTVVAIMMFNLSVTDGAHGFKAV